MNQRSDRDYYNYHNINNDDYFPGGISDDEDDYDYDYDDENNYKYFSDEDKDNYDIEEEEEAFDNRVLIYNIVENIGFENYLTKQVNNKEISFGNASVIFDMRNDLIENYNYTSKQVDYILIKLIESGEYNFDIDYIKKLIYAENLFSYAESIVDNLKKKPMSKMSKEENDLINMLDKINLEEEELDINLLMSAINKLGISK